MTFEVHFFQAESFFKKHGKFITESWDRYSLEFHMLDTSQEQIKLLQEAKQYFSQEKNIDREAKSALMKWFNRNISLAQEHVNANGSASASQSSHSNETLNTGESKGQITGKPEPEKIDWEAGLAELAFMFEILFKNEEIGCSMKQYKKRWALIAKHFTVKGKEITSEGLRHAFSQLKINKKEGMPRNHEIYKTLLTMAQEMKD
ncbi:uncharacterized protein METZ01_LOCUS340793 [marine metagenome]|uniref:Uncharacterized protein n=1 Tax=marine metagenome TaxID=408172 RepID=A0A382QQZ2_9ZZZZ